MNEKEIIFYFAVLILLGSIPIGAFYKAGKKIKEITDEHDEHNTNTENTA